jgi:uncharacterized protein DUF2158
MEKIAIGDVVVLKSGGPLMTVVAIEASEEMVQTTDCPLCGRYPQLGMGVSDGQGAIATAQQLWHTRHDTHSNAVAGAKITCGWIYDGTYRTETFSVEMLTNEEDEVPRHRRARRYRVR